MDRKIGRFEVKRLLGRGAQSAVYLAFDPHLEREVAIKTVHLRNRDPAQARFLLQEARTVSKMRHPSIVPIFEAGEQDGDPYLVFEYVEGRTLAQLAQQEGALQPARAVGLLMPVLDAIGHAHRFGTIHRDLKPSNILIDAEGAPRVMDFGIASKVSADAGNRDELLGTPAYMAPEYIARRTVGPQGDVFAAGLILFELVFGRRAIEARDAYEAMHRIANEPLVFPEAPRIDERLADIIAKATARDPELRYESAQQMKEALEAYLKPPVAAEEDGAGARAGQGALEFLLRRMRHKSDFPAMSEAIGAINRLTSSEKERVSTLSNSILKDFALTNKILRMVNSAFYRQAGGGNISTVSRAIVVLGFNTIRSIAISLILFEHMQNKQHAQTLKEEFLRASLGGIFAKELAGKFMPKDAEEAYVCALFHNLGRMLTEYYFPEEAEAVQRLMTQEKASEAAAASRVLGMSYHDLGVGVAKSWGFPESIIGSMGRLPPGEVRRPGTREERLRVLAGFSDAVCSVIESAPPEDRARELARLRERFGDSVPVTDKQFEATLEKSVAEVTEFCEAVRIGLKQTRIGRQLASVAPAPAPEPTDDEAAMSHTVLEAPAAPEPAAAPIAGEDPGAAAMMSTGEEESRGARPAEDAQAVLAAGIQDISNSLVEEFSLNDVLRIILETMYRAMGFERVLMCVRDARSGSMNGRFGFGPDVEEVARRFRFTIGQETDVFNFVLARGVDILISDATDPKFHDRIPQWYRRAVGAPTFILLPLVIKGAPVALIYADKPRAGEIVISEKELSLLRTLRNQAVLAIKQSA